MKSLIPAPCFLIPAENFCALIIAGNASRDKQKKTALKAAEQLMCSKSFLIDLPNFAQE